MSFEEKYKEEIDSLSFSSDCEIRLVEAVKKAEKNSKVSVVSKRKTFIALVAIVTAMIILSVSTTAKPTSYTPDATTVQYQMSNSNFEDRWKPSRKFPKTKGNEEYSFTVLGIASGEFINNCDGFSADVTKDYFVTAVSGHNGADLRLENGQFPIKITPLIYGSEPWITNSSTLCKDTIVAEKNGVIYYFFDTSFLERYEGRTLCFAFYEGDTPSSEIFVMKENGIITLNEDYGIGEDCDKFGCIIEIPRDMSDTHPEIAEEWLLSDVLSKLY